MLAFVNRAIAPEIFNGFVNYWLLFNSEADASCYLPPAVYSMCANSVWEFEAVATDLVTGAEVTVRQGVSVLTTLNRIDTACPA